MSSERKPSNPDDKAPEVERIRDIIFGSQMRTYEGNFQTLQRDIDRLSQEIDRLSDKLAEQDKILNQKLLSLERDLRKSDEGLRSELRDAEQNLMNKKVDRQLLGELFIELGSQLKAAENIVEEEPKPKVN
jgi:predicted  nucleic acid-binding Zn-ribbon protein